MPSTNVLEKIVLLRHGETEQGEPLDHLTPLNDNGRKQAECVGQEFDSDWLWKANVYCSTHLRCRQTYEGMCQNSAFKEAKVIYDPNLREVAYGYGAHYLDIEYELHCQERKKLGKFYYQFKGGESPAQAHMRACLFWESAHRQSFRTGRKNLLVVSHGMTIRLLVMRWMHWSPEDYNRMENLRNCQPIQIIKETGQWKVMGLNMELDKK